MLSEVEREIGILAYVSKTDGIGGRIKVSPDDFMVIEISDEVKIGDDGEHLIVEIEKVNWDTNQLIKELARRLRVSQRRFGVAGIKDKKAKTIQKISIRGVEWKEIEKINLKGVNIRYVGKSNRRIGIGDLKGNKFLIRIRDIVIGQKECEERILRIKNELDDFGGAPNFYGFQRFGSVRPITHRVGKALLKGDVEDAVMSYIAMPFEGERVKNERRELWERYLRGEHESGLGEILKRFPRHLRYERTMLSVIVSEGSYTKAFRALPINLQKLFIHGYQSYLFNRILSERILEGIPLNEPIPGEYVVFTKNGVPYEKMYELVRDDNISSLKRLINVGRGYVALPVIGYKTNSLPQYARNILEEEEVKPEDFKLKGELSELSSKGTLRCITID
jgi:tRNA pseudouridine13 synthase